MNISTGKQDKKYWSWKSFLECILRDQWQELSFHQPLKCHCIRWPAIFSQDALKGPSVWTVQPWLSRCPLVSGLIAHQQGSFPLHQWNTQKKRHWETKRWNWQMQQWVREQEQQRMIQNSLMLQSTHSPFYHPDLYNIDPALSTSVH